MPADNSHETWSDCPPGTLLRLSGEHRRLVRRQRSRTFAVATASGLVGATAVLLGLLLSWSDGRPQPGAGQQLGPSATELAGLSCAEVFQGRDAYLLGQASRKLQAEIRGHLERCPHCRGLYADRAQQLHIEFSARLPGIHAELLANR